MRLTVKTDGGYTVEPELVEAAIARLGAFEDMLEQFEADQARLPDELARLKADGREKTVTYRETLGRKLFNAEVADMFARAGVGS